ncbi:hypothetical protein CLI64_28130 [Nostoc sp. CENA543]|uniref:hypothetical protein n=1 Tax=Nostoc sp. CENA543 TaxID=1869241 RepID=UPI000CA39023|nr:hypothetical protein [Nostoc sp. CENA543]AUT03942.1 hypothetical protein CLI64_28130 [Nostoc sp. CENA543]
MNTRLGWRMILLSTTLFLSVAPLASAETPSRSIRNSQILPYLLDHPQDNSVVRVRCVPKLRQHSDSQRRVIRDSLLNSPLEHNDTVTIEIEGNCRNVRVRVQDDSNYSDYPVYDPYLDDHHPNVEDRWLTRQGSGWHWLFRNQR